jgi:hypothetical protein
VDQSTVDSGEAVVVEEGKNSAVENTEMES